MPTLAELIAERDKLDDRITRITAINETIDQLENDIKQDRVHFVTLWVATKEINPPKWRAPDLDAEMISVSRLLETIRTHYRKENETFVYFIVDRLSHFAKTGDLDKEFFENIPRKK